MTDVPVPPFARFLAHAAACRFAIAGVALHAALSATPIGGLPCPLLTVAGVPCPGCGVTRATHALAVGDWSRALELHALAPVVVGLLGLVLLSALASAGGRAKLVAGVARVEGHTKFTHAVGAMVVFYWVGRLVFVGLDYADTV